MVEEFSRLRGWRGFGKVRKSLVSYRHCPGQGSDRKDCGSDGVRRLFENSTVCLIVNANVLTLAGVASTDRPVSRVALMQGLFWTDLNHQIGLAGIIVHARLAVGVDVSLLRRV
jgi:hypothetical protein